jgi:hypothetical protein
MPRSNSHTQQDGNNQMLVLLMIIYFFRSLMQDAQQAWRATPSFMESIFWTSYPQIQTQPSHTL